MKKNCLHVIGLALILLVTGGIFTGADMADAKEIVLRLVTPAPADDYPLTYKDMELAKRFNERAKGEYKIEVHPGGALAKIPEYFDAVRVGAVEMADVNWAIFGSLDQKLGVMETAFLIDSIEGSMYMSKKVLPLYDALFQEKFNAKALSMFTVDGLQIVSTKPVKTLGDWKGLLAGASGPGAANLFKGLGAAPVVIMWTDQYESLQKKVIDATAQTAHGALAMSLMDVCKNITFFWGHGVWNGFTINLDTWKKMPKHIQQILQEEADKAAQWTEQAILKMRDDDMKAFKQKGTNIIVVPKAEREKWVKLLAPVRDREISNAGEFGAKIKKIADEANKKFPYDDKFVK
jgi:TRAP-type C4-dicarboxylate transport system substrate-binding protein